MRVVKQIRSATTIASAMTLQDIVDFEGACFRHDLSYSSTVAVQADSEDNFYLVAEAYVEGDA